MPGFSQDAVKSCIKSYLQANGLSYQDLADRSGLSLQTVNNYMSRFPISEKTVRRFANALGYPAEQLLRGEMFYGQTDIERLEARIRMLEDAVFGK